jgi:transposase
MAYKVAGIDVHKKVLMVVVCDTEASTWEFQRKRFGTTTFDLQQLSAWLRERGVQQAVMESTAQYWKPVWYELEPQMHLALAQAFSNRAPRGRKHDFRDAERLVRRLVAGELILSFVPEPEQRAWRTMTRMRVQLTRDVSRLRSQMECLLEEMRIKLGAVLSDLLGVSGVRILRALAQGERDPQKLAALGEESLHCSEKHLIQALTGHPEPPHRQLLGLYLDRYQLLREQMQRLDEMIAQAMKPHEEAVIRLAAAVGFGVDSAQQVIAEVGTDAGMFATAANLAGWAGTCPGQEETAQENHSSRSPKGNKYLRRTLNQCAHAAVKTKGSHFQVVFRRLLPRLGYNGAIWAVAHRLCRLAWKILHDKVTYVERGDSDPATKKRRAQALARKLRNLGYQVNITLITQPTAATA